MVSRYAGGLKAAQTNKERYGDDFYVKIGAMGGRKSRGGGFASEKVGSDGLTGRERTIVAGRKGGQASRKK